MSLIQVTDLSFTYEGSYDPVFEHVSFQIDTNWKLGFTGRNGRGKTTFLNLLRKQYEYTGRITASVAFDYFPFTVTDQERMTIEVLETLEGHEETMLWQWLRELSRLNLDEGVLYRPFHTLSSGEQTKVLLAALFLKEGNFLLIDEPTNHLDQEARELVSQYLNSKKGFLLVSHDRNFLDRCVDHMLCINKTNIEVQKGNFTSWYQNKQMQDSYEREENERLKKDIRRLEQAARQSARWADKVESTKIGRDPVKDGTSIDTRAYIGEKSRRMQQRRKNLERRQNHAIEDKQGLLKNIEDTADLKLVPARHHASRLVTLEQVVPCYDRPVCHPVDLEVTAQERIFLRGKNGCGKSSIIKAIAGADICGEMIHYTGQIRLASGLSISYVSQDTSGLQGGLREYAEHCGVEEHLLYMLLRKLDFSRSQLEKPIETFSEGQKKKVLIARSLCQQAHLYLWDEPLNFIDVYSRIQIEDLLQNFKPTMIVVEHDEAFTNNTATRIIQIERLDGNNV